VTALLQRLAPVARTIAWPALTGGALACVAVVVAAPHLPAAFPLARWPGLGALTLCVGAAFLLDDDAATTVDATPTSLAQRRLLRVALALPLLGAVWAAALWYATSAPQAWFGPDARVALSLQLGAMLALTLAASALALRALPGEHCGWTGAVAPFALLSAMLALPERWTLLAMPGDAAWAAVQQRWTALLVLGLITFAWAGREPWPQRPSRNRPQVTG